LNNNLVGELHVQVGIGCSGLSLSLNDNSEELPMINQDQPIPQLKVIS